MIDINKPLRLACGTPVRLLSLDGPKDTPLVGVVDEKEVMCWTLNGTRDHDRNHPLCKNLENVPRTVWLLSYDTNVWVYDTEQQAKSYAPTDKPFVLRKVEL